MSLNILIAEDNDFTTLQYNRILEKSGHKVVIAKNGEDCLKKYNAEVKKCHEKKLQKEPFDVVILDQSMPKKTGKEVAKEILKEVPNQRIIFASAYSLNGKNESKTNLSENIEYLQKPFSLAKFIRQIGN